jgi:hypothetical protein
MACARPALPAVIAAVMLAAGAMAGFAQPATRAVATVQGLLAFPTFYQLRSVIVRGELSTVNDRAMLSIPTSERGIEVIIKSGSRSDGIVEVRGMYWDVGRMTADDPHFQGFDIQSFLDQRTGGQWPAPGDLVVIGASDVQPAPPLPAPSVRTIALDPWRYEGQEVTVVGEFRGDNLYGDLPKAPTAGKWDFVLRSANGAIWVTGIRPRGRGFDLDPHARVDTGRILEVTGVVKTDGGLSWLVASAVSAPAVTDVLPLDEPPAADAVPPPPPMPPPEVIFSLPVEGETDVSPSAPVRVQMSRNLDPETLGKKIRATYVGTPPAGMPQGSTIGLTTAYNAGDRVVEIHWTKPLAPYRTIKVELLEGIKGSDGQALKPWTLTFTTGPE